MLRYVALGDSYTIGTSVAEADRFPNQLVAALSASPRPLRLAANLAVNGYTSADLIREELPALDGLAPEFVTVLIGVNDVVQGVPLARYEHNVVSTLEGLGARLPASRILAVTIPDYTVTPVGAVERDPGRTSAAIVAANEVMFRHATMRAIRFVDVFDISLRARMDRDLVAGDGLHPSALQYRKWVERIAPVVASLLAAD